MAETIVLPTKKREPKAKSPKNLILFGLPKVGKTTLLSELEDCLILDFENGADFVSAMSYSIDSLKKLRAVGEEIIKQNRPYKHVAIDTVTKLEDMCSDYAKYLYKQTPMGKSFEGQSVIELPSGAGYYYLRTAVLEMIDYISTLAPRVILIGHVKDKLIESKGEEFTSKALDLTGKLASIVMADSDAIGYIYRRDDDLFVNFKSSDSIVCGSRCSHLKDYNDKFDWNNIYID